MAFATRGRSKRKQQCAHLVDEQLMLRVDNLLRETFRLHCARKVPRHQCAERIAPETEMQQVASGEFRSDQTRECDRIGHVALQRTIEQALHARIARRACVIDRWRHDGNVPDWMSEERRACRIFSGMRPDS